jgi:hydroxylamine dehydrogenase
MSKTIIIAIAATLVLGFGRMRAFQGTFHASPDYAMWYGWSEMQRDLTEIKELATDMRRTAKK